MANMSFTNNAATTLASGINAAVTSLTVATGTGALFPSLTGSQYFYCTLANTLGAVEIVKVTARSTDTFTIVRAQDNTTAQSWSAGDKVELRLVAAELNNFPKLDETNTFALAQTFTTAPVFTDASGTRTALGLGTIATQAANNVSITGGSITGITDLAVADGGTGQSSYTDGQLLIGNTTGNTLTKATLTAGTGISVTNGSGSITIASTVTGITNATTQTATGAAVTFTGIPSGTKRIKIMLAGVSTNGTSNIVFRMGTSGGVDTSGYLSATSHLGGGTATTNFTNGFNIPSVTAANIYHGMVELCLLDATSNTWAVSGTLAKSDTNNVDVLAGSKAMSGTLDRVSVTMANGTDNFDAGSISIAYQS